MFFFVVVAVVFNVLPLHRSHVVLGNSLGLESTFYYEKWFVNTLSSAENIVQSSRFPGGRCEIH